MAVAMAQQTHADRRSLVLSWLSTISVPRSFLEGCRIERHHQYGRHRFRQTRSKIPAHVQRNIGLMTQTIRALQSEILPKISHRYRILLR